jgi:hypothetical protein
MKAFFVFIYELFASLFSTELADHLYGLSRNNDGTTEARSLYLYVGLSMLVISLVIAAVYYFAINSPKYNRWYHWITAMGTNAIINLLVGFYLPFRDYQAGEIADEIKPGIGIGDLWGFGFANAIVSLLFFFIFSLILQNKSRNYANVPFSLVGLFARKSKRNSEGA